MHAEVDGVLERVRAAASREDYAVAQAMLERERSHFDDPVAQARLSAAWSSVLAARGHHDQALASAKEAVAAIESGTDVPARYRAEVFNGLGAVHYRRDELEDAQTWFRRALSEYERDGDASLNQRGRARFNLSRVQDRLGQVEEALATAKRALDDETRSGAPACPDLAITRGHIAWLLERLQRDDESEVVLRTAIAECEAVDDAAVVRAQLQLSLGQVLTWRGDLTGALENVHAAKEALGTRSDLVALQVRTLVTEATIYRYGGELEAGLAALAIANELAVRLAPTDRVRFALCFEEVASRRQLDPDGQLAAALASCRVVAREVGVGPGSPGWAALETKAGAPPE